MSTGWYSYNRFRLQHPALAALAASLALGFWIVAVVGRLDTAAVAALLFFVFYFWCYRTGGPMRRRVLKSYDENGVRRDVAGNPPAE